ncbi:UDP-3-O-(3-hydroxymyristoyl)glucosamine N-acyltransferase [Clostridium paraputrificum]|uniref:UDP-3-O-(3-hydroxymyristoyl)glucosamine N-acyltransferase n=1 Tax=Clostridium TaxID=1485 RepID=UPI003D33DEA1
MKISEISSKIENSEVYREGSFETLGLSISKSGCKTLSFIDSEKYVEAISKDISCVITTRELADKFNGELGILICDEPRVSFFKLHNELCGDINYTGVPKKTIIGDNCKISKLASISDNNVVIGNNVVIEEFVVIRDNVVIGDNSILRAGVIIGGEGYECKREDDTIFTVKHAGGVVIGKDVEIQYNSCIDKAVYPWDNTKVGDYCKIDNLVHLGHACKIGRETMLAANSLVGGRTVIGEKCWVGISTTISNGLFIGDNVKMNIGSVVTRNVEDGASVTGNFAIEHSKFINFIKSIR